MVAPIKRGVNWLILGGDGQLGRSLGEELSKSGEIFHSLNRMQLDITNEDEIHSVFAELRPDVVVNAAAWTNVDAAEDAEESARSVNALGPLLLAKACSATHSKLVHMSTDYVFSGQSRIPWAEKSPLHPLSAYGRTKAEGEELVKENYPDGSYILRTAWLYGGWGENFAKKMLRLAFRDDSTINVVDDQIGQPTSSADLAAQIRLLIHADLPTGIYHATNGGEATWFEFARALFELAGINSDRLNPVSSQTLSRRAKRPAYSVLGHRRWLEVGAPPMPDWRNGLERAMPNILSAISIEE